MTPSPSRSLASSHRLILFERSRAILVLSRKKNEGITITGPDKKPVHLVVVEIRGDKVRLGIDAPKDVAVHRDEVQNAIDRAYPRTEQEKSPDMDIARGDERAAG